MPNSFRSIGLIARATSDVGNHLFQKNDLQNSQFIYLMRINEHPGITQTELASQLHVDPSTCLRVIRRLVTHDYVDRQTDSANKKARPLVATAKGQAIYPELKAYEQQILTIGTAGLSEGEKLILEELLAKVAHNIRSYQTK
ncbi:MarR family winged helix-turn-helix transcriptional regulator [Levilactobacillus huananensis]|uniref:MarR family winged helix-turn-helix transcriptional regulator n=1 Tax=Levilactobacillus huananensis TaxID=2486019 RepID=UPI000F78FDEC|nr:MarR family transcriptional regulator [Levilactobacillus huananensis]